MAQDTDRCPLCNRKLIMTAGVPTCPDCGYRDPYKTMGQNPPQKTGYSPVPPERPKKGGSSLVISVIVGIVVLLMTLGCGLISGLTYSYFKKTLHIPGMETDGEEYRYDGRNNVSDQRPAGTFSDRPQSDMLIELVEKIFGKDIDRISGEEIASVVYLHFAEQDDLDCMAVNYQLTDGTDGVLMLENEYLDTSDMSCFSGLEWLLMDEELDWNTDWNNLKNLSGLSCESSLSEIAGVMDVSQLEWLRAENGPFGEDFKDAGKYVNLQHLELEAGQTESLEGIAGMTSLRELILTEADNLRDYEELYGMTQLEILSIESQGLRDIGFVREMNALTQLELYETSVKNLDALEDCADTLKILRLEDNNGVEDYSVVLSCTGLEQLALYVKYDFNVPMQMPDLSALTELKILEIGNYDKFDNLEKLTGLEELTIADVGSGDGEALSSLHNLRVLRLVDMSVYEGFLDVIPSLSNLETLDLTDSFVWMDITPVFSAPNLQYLYLNDVDAGLDMRNMHVCESLTTLDMSDTTLYRLKEDGSWDYQAQGDGSQIALQDMEDFFTYLPNLDTLYIPDHDLQDVSFLAGMQKLFFLDVSDNYITDLSPLAELPQLRILICTDNPVRNREGLDNVIFMIED